MTVRRSALNVAIVLALASSATPAAAGVRALARRRAARRPRCSMGRCSGARRGGWSRPRSGAARSVGGGRSCRRGGARARRGLGSVAVRSGPSLFASPRRGIHARAARRRRAAAVPDRAVDPAHRRRHGRVGGRRVYLRRDGRRFEVALPPGADPGHVAFAGALGVTPVPEGALIVFSVLDGIEQRQISLGPFDGFNVSGLAISAVRRRRGDRARTATAPTPWSGRRPAPTGFESSPAASASAASHRRRARRVRLRRGLREGVRVVVVDGAPAARSSAAHPPSTSRPWPTTGARRVVHRVLPLWGGRRGSPCRRGHACER